MSMQTIEEQLLKFPASDIRLISIEWLEDGSLKLKLELPDKRTASLTCSFTSGLIVEFCFKEHVGGRPMTWDTTFAKLSDGNWHALLDFAGTPKQVVEFACSNIQLEFILN